MDKNAIKKFAVWARDELIAKVCIKAKLYGVDKGETYDINADTVNGRALSPQEKTQRQALIKQINSKGYDNVIEEIAYIWFNRFCALRYMEVNGYLPSRVRVFTDDEGNFNPQILSEALDLEIEGLDINKVYEYKKSNNDEELYKYLLTVQCNALGEILPGMFHKISDYAELLLPDKLLNEGSIIDRLVKDIPEEDWKDQVQIIGWLYQYYNTEPKDVVFTNLKKNVKISKENIAPATQLFTPDWIVRYMVENSLGRLWLEGHENEELKSGWKYYLDEAEQTEEVRNQLEEIRREKGDIKPEDIKCIDPCMGSGHILCYMFDILMQIYESYGYTSREAVESIVTKNLYGLDIDERASQLAYFAVMMKARQYDRRFFSRHIQPNVYDFQNLYLNPDDFESPEIRKMITVFRDADEYGSLLDVKDIDIKAVSVEVDNLKEDLFNLKSKETLVRMVKITEILQQKYDVVCTNPPYLGSNRFNVKLSNFIQEHYKDEKADLSMVMFRFVVDTLLKTNGYTSFITTSSWFFLSSFEKLRNYILTNYQLTSIVDFGTELFDGKVGHNPIVSWVLQKTKPYTSTIAIRLVDYCYSQRDKKQEEFFNKKNRYTATQENFSKIPGSPVAYWVSGNVFKCFMNYKKIDDVSYPRQGLATGNNDKFLRLWYEVNLYDIKFDASSSEEFFQTGLKYIPYNKGGSFRKWYAKMEFIIRFDKSNYDILATVGNHLPSKDFYFRESITWSKVTSGSLSMRYIPKGSVFDVAGCSIFCDNKLLYILGFTNSRVMQYLMSTLSQTLNYEVGNVKSIPIRFFNTEKNELIVEENIQLSKTDWDSYETSWDFKRHPFLENMTACGYADENLDEKFTISSSYSDWKYICNDRFQKLKANEEELNRIFIEIYGLQDELTPEEEDKDVTVHCIYDTKEDVPENLKGSNYVRTKCDEIVSFISYAVGCMFGRYSLDVEGLAYAGGEWDDSKYKTFIPDKDGIIPICDDEYFEDDIVNRFCDFVKTVYGEETLEENLRFIADALGGKGSSREVIRSYFMNDFYKDHCKVYQKRPIYWLFDSGKKNGFKCLIYMHRYKTDTIMRIRTDYVHELQSRYRTAIEDLQKSIEKATATERVKLTKQLTKLKDQSDEIRTYEEKIHHLADMQISIDLDDGVKHNYELFSDVLGKIK